MRSGGKSFAALGSTGINDGTAGFGAHPGTKTVASFAFYIARLKRSLAHFYILFRCLCQLKEMATPFKALINALISVCWIAPRKSGTMPVITRLAKYIK
jgi:hypothetical protein